MCACVCRRCVLCASVIDTRVGLSMLMHRRCFKCLLPWKQAASIQVWYTDNGLSLVSPLLLHSLFTQFSLAPTLPSLSFSPIVPFSCQFPASIFTHSCQSSLSEPTLLSLFSFSLTFLPLSIHSCQRRCHALKSISSSPYIILFISPSFHPSMCLPDLHLLSFLAISIF